MDNLLLLIILFVFQLFEFLFVTKILQNQYYSLKRFLMYKNSFSLLFKSTFVVFSLPLLVYDKRFILILALVFTHKRKNMIVKLTKRVIRHLTCFCVLFSINIFFVFYSHFTIMNYIFFIYNLSLYYVSFGLSVFIEKKIQKHFIKKAKKKIRSINPLIIGITGSYGKTSCKKYIYELLKTKYKTLSTPESYNTLNGITKTINDNLKPYHQVLLLEIGVDSKNGMNNFLKNYNFDISVLTCVGKQHMKTFKSFKNIMNEKIKLINNSKLISIINNDDEYSNFVTAKKSISFSVEGNDADIKIEKSFDKELKAKKLNIKIKERSFSTITYLYGNHNISNLACAISVAYYLNIPFEEMIKTIPFIKNVNHRLSVFQIDKWLFIDDSYNSNFIGFKNALTELNYYDTKKVIITPGIIEQGNKQDQENVEIAEMMNSICDIIILIKNPPIGKLINQYLSFNSFKESYTYLEKNYKNEELTILIENDVPDIFLRWLKWMKYYLFMAEIL